eukprot:1874765-Prymnesium_polylepis.1
MRSPRRAARQTAAPASARARAIAAPMPPDAPVTTAHCPTSTRGAAGESTLFSTTPSSTHLHKYSRTSSTSTGGYAPSRKPRAVQCFSSPATSYVDESSASSAASVASGSISAHSGASGD